jgi:hypothetical protein
MLLNSLIPLENRRLLYRSPTGNMDQPFAWSFLNLRYPISNFLGDCLLTRVSGLFRSAAYVEDIEIRQHFRYFNTHSDVFAVHQPQDVSPSFISGKPRLTIVYLLQNLFFTGTRSGSIIRFDTRLPKSYGDHLFCGSSGSKNERAPIRHLHVIRQWQLIASCANGDVRVPPISHGQTIMACSWDCSTYASLAILTL